MAQKKRQEEKGSGYWYYRITIRYELTLEDGEKLFFYYSSSKPQDIAITFIVGDQIEFLSEKRQDPYGDFSNVAFTAKVTRDLTKIGTFDLIGMERRDYQHLGPK